MKTSKMHREKEANVAKDASEQSFWVWCCCVWESCSVFREQATKMGLVLFLLLLSIWAIQWKMKKERKKTK